jgi:hypothetical protein
MEHTDTTEILLVISDVVKPEEVNSKIMEHREQNAKRVLVRPVDENRVVVTAEYPQTLQETIEYFN